MESARRIWRFDELRRSVPEPKPKAQVTDLHPLPHAPPIVLVGEREHRLYVFVPERIDYIEADDNYVRFHSGSAEYISRNSIKALTVQLNDRGFIRIARSLLLNVRAISYAERAGDGRFSFTLNSGSCLRSSATYREEILRVIPLAQSRALPL